MTPDTSSNPTPKHDEMTTELLKLSDMHLDARMRPSMERGSNPPKALQGLEVLDLCIFGSLSSGFTTQVLQVMYDGCCADEKTTHEEVVKLATWRNKL